VVSAGDPVGPVTPSGSASSRLRELFDRAWAETMADQPELATYAGWPEYHDRWTDLSPEAVARRRATVGDHLAELGAIDPAELDSDLDRTSYEMFGWVEQAAVAASAFPGELLALTQLDGPQVDPTFLLSIMPRDRGEDLLGRLRRLPDLVDQTVELLRSGLAAGVTPPQVCLRAVPDQLAALLSQDATRNPALVALAGAEDDVVAEGTALVLEQVLPAFRRLQGFVTGTYLPGCRVETAWTSLPDGGDWYAERVHHHTTTDLSPADIHEIGLAEVTRIEAAMDEVMTSTGFTGERAGFAAFLRTDPRFYFATEADLLRAYRDIAKRIDGSVVRLFSRLPRLPFGIVAVPPEQAPSQPAAYYMPGALELARPGVFYANTYDLASRPSWNMESICLHEAVPGHHFQIALAQETDGLPEFRRQSLSCTAYIEGWGLYCESLGDELGMYTDPYQRFGALDAEMMRACRLVLDTGMHALGWSRERAIEFFTAHSPSPEHELVVEVDRYLVWPGQALSYKVGQLRIQHLRARAAAQLGARFDLRAFHDELLRHGALPLGMLDAKIDAFLATT
jgi:uncharacterized protein (DUF885 family)